MTKLRMKNDIQGMALLGIIVAVSKRMDVDEAQGEGSPPTTTPCADANDWWSCTGVGGVCS